MECDKDGNSQTIAIQRMPKSDQWVLFNKQMSALCKVNYDAQNWELLIETLTSKSFENIHQLNRAQLIEDIMHFARTGEQDYSIALKLISYLEQERSYFPWSTAFKNLELLGNILQKTDHLGLFKVRFKKIFYKFIYFLYFYLKRFIVKSSPRYTNI